MTNIEKLDAVERHVKSLGLTYNRTKHPELHSCHLYIFPQRIAIHICGERDDEFRKKYKRRLYINDSTNVDDLNKSLDEFIDNLNYYYAHRDEINAKKQQGHQYHLECLARHEERVKRREAHERRLEEKKMLAAKKRKDVIESSKQKK